MSLRKVISRLSYMKTQCHIFQAPGESVNIFLKILFLRSRGRKRNFSQATAEEFVFSKLQPRQHSNCLELEHWVRSGWYVENKASDRSSGNPRGDRGNKSWNLQNSSLGFETVGGWDARCCQPHWLLSSAKVCKREACWWTHASESSDLSYWVCLSYDPIYLLKGKCIGSWQTRVDFFLVDKWSKHVCENLFGTFYLGVCAYKSCRRHQRIMQETQT